MRRGRSCGTCPDGGGQRDGRNRRIPPWHDHIVNVAGLGDRVCLNELRAPRPLCQNRAGDFPLDVRSPLVAFGVAGCSLQHVSRNCGIAQCPAPMRRGEGVMLTPPQDRLEVSRLDVERRACTRDQPTPMPWSRSTRYPRNGDIGHPAPEADSACAPWPRPQRTPGHCAPDAECRPWCY